MSFDAFDYSIAVGTVIALVALILRYHRNKPDSGLPWFDASDYPPPGSTDGQKREWRRAMRERKINRDIPVGGYQPKTDIKTPPPNGGSGVPDLKP